MRNFNTFTTGLTRAKSQLAAAGVRAGALRWAPSRLLLRGEEPGIDAYLSQVLGLPVQVALYIGPRRAVQKPVLQVIDPSGHTIGFAKVGINELTRRLVRREADALRAVATHDTRVLRVPDIVHAGVWEGHELLVQEAVPPGRSRAAVRRWLPEATAEVGRIEGTTWSAWPASTYRRRLGQRQRALVSHPCAPLLTAALDLADRVVGTDAVEFGCSHGDWASWNFTANDDYLVAWDWEHFARDVPLGLDAVHHDIAERTALRGLRPAAAFADLVGDLPTALTGTMVGASAAPRAVALYVVEILTRYLEDDEARNGTTAMSRVSDWVPPTLGLLAGSATR
ncbi:hypothetical protein D9V37_15735 [Nocardioides mangrovicus]|uniref:Aminoglycoside phosphotransferase domain-containing protein n=1 Tax=Nocardioides mangrovicus TaxID=2478913 RepID=A0A3L8NXF9_9ACTN|nr:hypothetical protein [Nocardioides mangrovicus]RLV47614.1 hypothetical protein D9V37_15735 [Nocardioides mangrovicus]